MLTLYCFVKYSYQIETLLEVLPDSMVLFAVLHKHLTSGCLLSPDIADHPIS
jgi:hypothetical protein